MRRVPIESLYTGLFDGPHATPKPSEEGPVFLGIGNITEDGKLDLTDVRHIAEEDYATWTRRVTPQPGDIVFTYEATLNRYAIIPKGFRGCLGRRTALIRPNVAAVNPRFLFLYFFSEDWRNTIAKNILSGATVDRIPLTRFPSFPVTLPERRVQDRVADILSAYDDLIENNTRRIKILEEMAQMIYREWFVNFRFPGHEKVRMVESELGPIPEGWEAMTIAEVVQILGGGTPSTTVPEYWESGDVSWYSPSDLTAAGTMFVSDSSKHITRLGLEKSSARLFPTNSVMMTSRATIGVVAINKGQACTNQGFITCVPGDRVSAYQLYFWLLENKPKIVSLATGATFKEINKATFRQLPILVAPQAIADALDKAISPMGGLIANLIHRNSILRTTRDLLLPKLISGEIPVEAADDTAAELMEEIALHA